MISQRCRKTLVLDAMGVIYKSADDVVELLIPFISAHGGQSDAQIVDDAYMRASLGQITAREFWLEMNVDPALEDEYLSEHVLNEGLMEFLPKALEACDSIMCLSNDVSEWSAKLRRRFGLEEYFSRWFISGDMHLRKPDVRIYRHMLSAAGMSADEVVFVDDRAKNLLSAQELGMWCVLFNPAAGQDTCGLPVAADWSDILRFRDF